MLALQEAPVHIPLGALAYLQRDSVCAQHIAWQPHKLDAPLLQQQALYLGAGNELSSPRAPEATSAAPSMS